MADYYGLTGDPVGVLKSALARDPGFALGGVAIAALYMIGGFRGDHPEVMSALRAAEAAIGARLTARAEPSCRRQGLGAGELRRRFGWERILADHPTDALALRLVQDAYFLLGRSAAIRDCADGCCPPGVATIRSPASSSGNTPSGSRRRANSGAPRTSAARRSPAIRATPGRRMRWPM